MATCSLFLSAHVRLRESFHSQWHAPSKRPKSRLEPRRLGNSWLRLRAQDYAPLQLLMGKGERHVVRRVVRRAPLPLLPQSVSPQLLSPTRAHPSRAHRCVFAAEPPLSHVLTASFQFCSTCHDGSHLSMCQECGRATCAACVEVDYKAKYLCTSCHPPGSPYVGTFTSIVPHAALTHFAATQGRRNIPCPG